MGEMKRAIARERVLVRDTGWSSQKYQDWLADTLVRALLGPDYFSNPACSRCHTLR
jgi:hypothetical protein